MTSEEDISLTREFTVDAGDGTRLAWELLKRLVFQRPAIWILIVIIVISALLASRQPQIALVPIVLTLMAVFLTAGTFFAARRGFTRQYPVGTVIRTGFGETRFSIESPTVSSKVAYAVYRRAVRRGSYVWLRVRATRAWGAYPGALFGDDDLARFPQN